MFTNNPLFGINIFGLPSNDKFLWFENLAMQLKNSRLKIKRADKHIADLDARIGALPNSDIATIEINSDGKTKSSNTTLQIAPPWMTSPLSLETLYTTSSAPSTMLGWKPSVDFCLRRSAGSPSFLYIPPATPSKVRFQEAHRHRPPRTIRPYRPQDKTLRWRQFCHLAHSQTRHSRQTSAIDSSGLLLLH